MVEKIERKIPASVEKVYTLFAAAHAGTAFLGESLNNANNLSDIGIYPA